MREPQSSKHFLPKDVWMLMGLIASPFHLIDKSSVLVEQCVHLYSFYFIRLTVAVTPHRNCAIAIFPTEIAHLVPPNETTQQLHVIGIIFQFRAPQSHPSTRFSSRLNLLHPLGHHTHSQSVEAK